LLFDNDVEEQNEVANYNNFEEQNEVKKEKGE
jgi:hypothetical protein